MKQLCMHCEDNDHFIKNCKLLSAVQSCIINVVTAKTVKKTTEEEKNSEKEQLLAKVTAESVQDVIKAERSLRIR